MLTVLCGNSQVKVNFTNASKEKFKSLKVKGFVFKDLGSGKSTEGIELSGSYRYCYAEVITEKDTIFFVPIDYVGETYYTSGKLNMKLQIRTGEDGKRYLNFIN
jgi:hypothetical protein